MNRRRRFKAKRRRAYRKWEREEARVGGMTVSEFRDMLEWAASRDGQLFLQP